MRRKDDFEIDYNWPKMFLHQNDFYTFLTVSVNKFLKNRANGEVICNLINYILRLFLKKKSATNWSKRLQLNGMTIVTSHFVYGAMKNVLFHENFFDVFVSRTFFNCIQKTSQNCRPQFSCQILWEMWTIFFAIPVGRKDQGLSNCTMWR